MQRMRNKNTGEKQNMTVTAKLHKKDDRTVIAVCDSVLIGTKLEENGIVLDLGSDFYNGEEYEPTTIGDLIRNADAVNLVGEESVKLGIEEEIIDETTIKKVKGIPYAQAIILHD